MSNTIRSTRQNPRPWAARGRCTNIDCGIKVAGCRRVALCGLCLSPVSYR